jgi:glycosyltransferase involved in cell wall biosynthesis
MYIKFLNPVISFFLEIIYGYFEPIKLKNARNNSKFDYDESNPLISVYVPTFNRCSILMERAIPSVLNQTYSNFEFIVIGDGCSDNTEQEVLKIKDDRIKFVNIKRKKRKFPSTVKNHWLAGPVIPANYALKIARGKWIARTDDDEQWTKDHLEKLLEFAVKNNKEFVTADVETIRDGVTNIDKGHKMYSDYFRTKHLQGNAIENPEIGGTSTVFYRSFLKSFKYNKNCWRKPINSANDIDLYVRFIKAGVKIGHLNHVVTLQHPRPGENTVGWDAYDRDQKNKIQHFSDE